MPSSWTERVRNTLGFRLALWYAALFATGVISLFALTYALLAASLERRDHDAVRATLAEYVTAYTGGGLQGLLRTINTAQQMGAHADLFVRVAAGGDEVVYLSLPAKWAGFDVRRMPKPPAPGETDGWIKLPARQGDAVLEVASISLRDGTLFQVGRSSAGREELLGRFRSVLFTVTGMTLFVGFLGGVVLTHWSLRPLRNLTRTLQRIIETGQLSARVPVRHTGDPLDELSALFNSMLDRIEGLLGAMRDSLDNVAHDLRTPLMRLRASAEQALAAPPDATLAREALADCLEESERVLTLLEALMDIAEAENGAMRLALEPLPVRELFDRTVELYADLAEEKGIALRIDCPADLRVRADRSRIGQVLANLVDNAIKYTPSGGTVELLARRDGPEVLLTVSDTGIGIPPRDIHRVWDRLFRGDESRSERGLGLGLSLVKAIVQAHNGRVSVESDPGRGSRFRLWLPAAPAALEEPAAAELPAADVTRM
jgi:signal transduction histidine kinase